MRVYHYHPDTGAWLGVSSEADESPLEPGVFLIPAYATSLVPPETGEGELLVFRGEWVIEAAPEPLTPPPPPDMTKENILAAPRTLFGGPMIAEVFKHGH